MPEVFFTFQYRRRLPLLKFIIPAALMAAASTPAFAQDMRKNLTAQEVSQMLRNDGYTSVEILDEEAIRLRVDGTNYLVVLFDDGDLQMYMGLSGDASLSEINAWNRDKRLSRAYIDKEGDPVIEADLLADQGITDSQFSNFVDVFLMSANAFREHVN